MENTQNAIHITIDDKSELSDEEMDIVRSEFDPQGKIILGKDFMDGSPRALKSGDIMHIRKISLGEFEIGKLYLIETQKQFAFGQITDFNTEHFTLHRYNPKYSDEKVLFEDVVSIYEAFMRTTKHF